MRVVDLHPEDLLEKEAQGSLEAGDRARLEAHLAHCAACRLERQLRADFADELEAEMPLERVIGLGIEQPPVIEQAPMTVPTPRQSLIVPRGRRRLGRRAVWLLAAAVLLVGGAAAAAMGLSETRWAAFRVVPAVIPAAIPPAATTHAKTHAVVAPRATPPEPEPVATAEATVPEAIAAPPPPTHSSPVTPAPTVVGPAELFDQASDARRRGDYGRVLDLDGQLEHRYPSSREAQVSRQIVGRLLLDRGDPTGALARFDSYLAAGAGDLAEEAMVGRATALDRLGRADDATRAWSAVAAAFPDSPYAARARARLESSNGH
jgi:TolA-binding protein